MIPDPVAGGTPGGVPVHDLASASATAMERVLARLDGLRRLDGFIVRGGAPDALAAAALAHLRSLVPAGRAAVITYDHIGGTGRLLAVDEATPLPEAPAGRVFPLVDIVPAELLAAPATRVFADLARDLADMAASRLEAARGYRAALWAPMVLDGALVGMVAMVAADAAAFAGDAAEIAEEIAGQLAIGLKAAGDAATIRRGVERLERSNARLALIHEIDAAILRAESPGALAQAVADRLLGLTTADLVGIARYGTGDRAILAVAGLGADDIGRRLAELPPGAPAPGVLEPGRVLVFPDLRAAAATLPPFPVAVEQGLTLGLVVPLAVGDRVVGAISLAGRDAALLGPDSLEVAREVGDQLAVAIQHAADRTALAEREARLRAILEASPNGILAITPDGIVGYANPAAHGLFGAEPGALAGMAHDLLVPVADQAAHPERIAGWFREHEVVTNHPLNTEARRLDGTTLPVHVLLAGVDTADGPLAIATIIDLSERTGLEARLRQAERLEVLGQFAGILAHDVRNYLTAIAWSADLLASDLPADDPRHADVALISKATQDAVDMTRSMLEFARPTGDPSGATDVAAHLAGARAMLDRIVGEAIRLELGVDVGLPPAAINATALTQVLVNLAANARDAMPEGGTLRISAGLHVAAPGASTPDAGLLVPGRYVRMLVADTGAGMDEVTRDRAFEAFFTTKTLASTARGTGLGLSSVFLIVSKTGGAIRIASEPGAGTAFTLDLPAVGENRPGPSQRPVPMPVPQGKPRRVPKTQ